MHPNWDLLDDVKEEKPKEKPKYAVSGGLTGFPCANDLLFIDFSPPAEAPEEFRAVAYDSNKLTTLKSGISGKLAIGVNLQAVGLFRNLRENSLVQEPSVRWTLAVGAC